MRILKIGKKMSKLGQWLEVGDCDYGILWRCKRHIRSRELLRAKRRYEVECWGAPWLGRRY